MFGRKTFLDPIVADRRLVAGPGRCAMAQAEPLGRASARIVERDHLATQALNGVQLRDTRDAEGRDA